MSRTDHHLPYRYREDIPFRIDGLDGLDGLDCIDDIVEPDGRPRHAAHWLFW